jgi:DNA-binding MarR family transcriptional regulator
MENNKARSLVNKMVNLYDYFSDSKQAHEDALNQYLHVCGYKGTYDKGIKLSEYHVIDCIGRNRFPNATFISKEMNMTIGAISKIAAKLMSSCLIKADHLQNNKKEVFYTLTPQGKDAFEVHEKIHALNNNKLNDMFGKYGPDELNTIARFIDDILTLY